MDSNFWIYLGFFIIIAITGYICVSAYLKARDVTSFFIAKREAKWYIIVGSLMASTVSGASFFGMMGWFYDLGASVFWIPLGVAWSWFIICYFVGPKLRRFGQFTIPDYLAERFDSPQLRPVFSIIVTVWMVILLGTVYIQGGLLFTQMFGLDYNTSIIVIGLIVVLFTIFGGMIAVLNSDFLAMFVLLFAILISIPIGLNAAGGWTEVTTLVKAEKPDYFTNASSIGWMGALSWFFIWCFGYLGHPGYLTRFYTALNVREIVKSGIAISLLYLPFWVFVFIAAAAARILYPTIGDSELVWLTYMYEYAPAFLVGLGMAGIFSAILSSANSWLLAASTSLGRDIYQKLINKEASDAKVLAFSKLTILLLGALAVPIGIWRPNYIMELMNIAYLVAGCSGGLVIMVSLYYKDMTKEAAWAGIISGALISIIWRTLSLTNVITISLDPIIPTLLITLLIILVVSKITKPSEKSVIMFNRLNDRSLNNS